MCVCVCVCVCVYLSQCTEVCECSLPALICNAGDDGIERRALWDNIWLRNYFFTFGSFPPQRVLHGVSAILSLNNAQSMISLHAREYNNTVSSFLCFCLVSDFCSLALWNTLGREWLSPWAYVVPFFFFLWLSFDNSLFHPDRDGGH